MARAPRSLTCLIEFYDVFFIGHGEWGPAGSGWKGGDGLYISNQVCFVRIAAALC